MIDDAEGQDTAGEAIAQLLEARAGAAVLEAHRAIGVARAAAGAAELFGVAGWCAEIVPLMAALAALGVDRGVLITVDGEGHARVYVNVPDDKRAAVPALLTAIALAMQHKVAPGAGPEEF